MRNKTGTTLTSAGRQFQRHAAVLTSTVELARQEIGVVSGFESTLTVGGRVGLWDGLLLTWLPEFLALAPHVAARAQIFGFEDDLMQALIDGRVHLGVMYTPQARPGLTIEPLFEETLVMVSTQQEPPLEPAKDYVYVDWGSGDGHSHLTQLSTQRNILGGHGKLEAGVALAQERFGSRCCRTPCSTSRHSGRP